MKYILLTLFFCLFTVASTWAEKTSLREHILKLLPQDLAALNNEHSRQEIEKRFAKKIQKPKKEDPDTIYLHYFEHQNDVTIGLKAEKMSYLYIELPQEISAQTDKLFSEFYSGLSEEQKKKIAQENQKKISHEGGRYILLDLPEEGLKLEFYNNEKRLLRSAIIYSLKEKK